MGYSHLVKKIEAIPTGYTVKATCMYALLTPWVSRNHGRLGSDRFVERLADAKVWKTATGAQRFVDRFQPDYGRLGWTFELVPLYGDPRRLGHQALEPTK
jgi:hypothetical protein